MKHLVSLHFLVTTDEEEIEDVGNKMVEDARNALFFEEQMQGLSYNNVIEVAGSTTLKIDG